MNFPPFSQEIIKYLVQLVVSNKTNEGFNTKILKRYFSFRSNDRSCTIFIANRLKELEQSGITKFLRMVNSQRYYKLTKAGIKQIASLNPSNKISIISLFSS